MSRRLALVGCGLIGGSLALALREAGAVTEVVGHDADADVSARAVALGICDRAAAGLADAVEGAAVVVLAVPVGQMAAAVATLAACKGLAADAVVTDVASTKARIVAYAEDLLGARFVGGHPMAGTEHTGPDAARADLFRGRVAIVTPTCRTDAAARAVVEELWRAAGAEVELIDPDRHDDIVARLSHLPHVAAYALVNAIARRPVADLIGLAGGGFIDTTRIAATPPRMMADVFADNRDALLPLVDELVHELQTLSQLIRSGARLEATLRRANEARARILG